MASQVIRANAAADRSAGLSQKYERLLEKADLGRFVRPGDQVAVKMHFGEPGNARYLRPIFPVLLVDRLKSLGARPFVTDTAVLYKSLRHQAYEYYDVARRNGFTSEVLGCPIIISGGLSDRSVKIPVPEPMRLTEVGISSEIYEADALISLAHVTLHLQYPIGAALKNVGMGCVDIDTKLAMHDARGTNPRHLAQYEATCDGARAVLAGFKGKFYAINLLLDITPDCDCFERSDLPVVPDLGILGSDDPVAVDKASYDLILAAPGYPGSKLDGSNGMNPGGPKVQPIYPKIDPEAYFQVTQHCGIGSTEFHLLDL
ncbi:MAG TPA: DUF362 domain-containing protein [bacterium]|jgi:uncharacterized Fe-S center protein